METDTRDAALLWNSTRFSPESCCVIYIGSVGFNNWRYMTAFTISLHRGFRSGADRFLFFFAILVTDEHEESSDLHYCKTCYVKQISPRIVSLLIWSELQPSDKFGENRAGSFCIILQTDGQM